MNRFILLFYLVCSLPALNVSAQVIGDDALLKVQSGEVSFMEGEFIVFLNDTVSPDYIERQFANLGFEISYSDIKPLQISIVNSPADSILGQLKNHPEVQRFFSMAAPLDSAYFKDLLEQRGLTGEILDQTYERLIESQSREELLFEFNYSINEYLLKNIMGDFRSIAYQILQNYTRSVNVACTPGKEQELMKEIEKLPYVKSTALIGILSE